MRALAITVALAAVTIVWAAPVARAETVQSCRRRGCKLNVNTYRCICRRRVRPPRLHKGRVPRLRCPRRTRRQVSQSRLRHNKNLWDTVYRCVRHAGPKVIFHGPVVQVRPDGSVAFRGRYRDGARHGTWRYSYKNGKRQVLVIFSGGKHHGPYTAWHSNSRMSSQGTWLRGAKTGLWKRWHRNGKLRDQGTYAQNKRTGLWTFWHRNGQKGSVGFYKNNRLHGVRKTWNTRGQLTETAHFTEGRRHGKCTTNRNGIRTVSHYHRGSPHGIYREWYKNGKLNREMPYRHGRPHGVAKSWNPKGVLVHERAYVNKQRHGLEKQWHANGKLRLKGRWERGRKVGTWIRYAADGSVLSRRTHR